jgi:hypothetical protein
MSAFSKLALREFEFESATPIQSLVWPALASANRDVLFGAETGSGKSLAYLVPLMLRLKQLEVAGSGSSSGSVQEGGALGMRPRAVVVVPTRELVTQVTTVAKRLAHVYKLRIRALSAAHSERVEANALVSHASAVACDLLVTTPGRFAAHRASRSLFVSEIAFAAFDEADVLCDRGFRADLDRIVTPLLAKRTRDGATACQFSLCGATLTNELRHYARQTFGSRLAVIETPSLHHSVAGARHEFLSVDRLNKLKTLTRVVRACRANGEVALVFCGSVDSCRFVAHEFDEASLPHVSLHAQLPPHDAHRTRRMRRIAAGRDVNGVIVATDVLARGSISPTTSRSRWCCLTFRRRRPTICTAPAARRATAPAGASCRSSAAATSSSRRRSSAACASAARSPRFACRRPRCITRRATSSIRHTSLLFNHRRVAKRRRQRRRRNRRRRWWCVGLARSCACLFSDERGGGGGGGSLEFGDQRGVEVAPERRRARFVDGERHHRLAHGGEVGDVEAEPVRGDAARAELRQQRADVAAARRGVGVGGRQQRRAERAHARPAAARRQMRRNEDTVQRAQLLDEEIDGGGERRQLAQHLARPEAQLPELDALALAHQMQQLLGAAEVAAQAAQLLVLADERVVAGLADVEQTPPCATGSAGRRRRRRAAAGRRASAAVRASARAGARQTPFAARARPPNAPASAAMAARCERSGGSFGGTATALSGTTSLRLRPPRDAARRRVALDRRDGRLAVAVAVGDALGDVELVEARARARARGTTSSTCR